MGVIQQKAAELTEQFMIRIYNDQYSFTTYLKQNMSNAYLSLQLPTLKQNHQQNTLISLYEELSTNENPQRMQELSSTIFNFICQAEESHFQASLQLITKMFDKGYANFVAESPLVTQKIMKYFVILFKRYESQPSKALQYRKLFVLSVIAELIRQQSKSLIAFSRQFLLKVFQIECQEVEELNERNQLLAILGVIFSYLSRQSKLIKELKVGKSLKGAILNNYSFIQQSYTLRLFNQSILQLQTRRTAIFTLCELERYRIKEKLLSTISNHQGEHLMHYLEKLFPRSINDTKTKPQ